MPTPLAALPLTLAAGDEVIFIIPIVAMAIGGCIAITSIIASAARVSTQRKLFEESRREIAAYVAEGSIKPEDAERLLKADMPDTPDSKRKCAWFGTHQPNA